MRLLYFIRDPYPNTRSDVLTLFGRRLHALGIVSDVVANRYGDLADRISVWPSGAEYLHNPSPVPGIRALGNLIHDVRMLSRARQYDAIVVRDKIATAFLAVIFCERRKVFYWMSFPFPEEDLLRSRSNREGILRRCALWLRSRMTALLLYDFVVPRSARVFVQSERMRDVVAARSGRSTGLIPIPMGVDESEIETLPRVRRQRLAGEPFRLMYLGTMDRIRRIDFLLDVIRELSLRDPDCPYRLVLIGGASTISEYEWLNRRVKALSLESSVEMTGPLPRAQALAHASGCHVGISAIPRGEVFDVSSPTKTAEYLALGLPVLVNDIPDQAMLVERTGAGLCRPMEVDSFVNAILEMKQHYDHYAAKAANAGAWVLAARGYDVLSARVAESLREARSVST